MAHPLRIVGDFTMLRRKKKYIVAKAKNIVWTFNKEAIINIDLILLSMDAREGSGT